MSTAISPVTVAPAAEPLVPPVSRLAGLRHRRYSVEEYEELVRQGRIWANDRCELILGVITDKMGIGDLHAACVMQLNLLFSTAAANRYLVSIQNPIIFADSVSEPDCALVAFRRDCYRNGKPQASDVLLLIEVADSSLDYDREVKLPLYAKAGIADFWIANVLDDCVEVYRQPSPAGDYAPPRIAKRGETISLLCCRN